MSNQNIITNFTEYFRKERDVFVQNRSNTQVSMQFEAEGRSESVLIPRGKKPLNLTQLVSFKMIKESLDLRKLVNRRPPVLVLLSEEQYIEHYQKLADSNGITLEEAMDNAHQYQSDLQNKRAFTKPVADSRKTLDQEAETRADEPPDPQDKVSPRVTGLCANVGDDVAEKDRMKAGAMLEEIKELNTYDKGLTRGDLEFLLGRGYYASVKKWATGELERRS